MKKLWALTTFVICMAIMFMGCAKTKTSPSPLVGNWYLEDGQNFSGIVEDYKLFEDGTGITDNHYAISWKIENGRFNFVYESDSKAWELDCTISGETLTITFDDGRSFIYKKYSEKPNDFGNWRSMIVTDPITDNKRITFKSSLDQNPLFIRWDGGELEMFIGWGVNLGTYNIDVTFRIDDKAPETKKWDLSTDEEASFYPGNPLSTVKSLLDAKQAVARCTPPNKSPTTLTFDLTGLKEIATKYNDDLKWF